MAEKIKKGQFKTGKLGRHGDNAGDLGSGPGFISAITPRVGTGNTD